MRKKSKTWILLIIGLLGILGGCFNMDTSNENVTENNEQNEYEMENFVPVQDYTGEGFTLRDSREETGKIAEEHRSEVEKAVKQFFLDSYNTEIKVHNIVSAADGVSVFVESIGEPHFYTFAIVPVDIDNKKVITDGVRSEEGQVENAIKGGLYAMAFEEEFKNLDEYLEEKTKELPITGKRMEAIANVRGTGYSTSYYFLTPFGDISENLYDLYMEKPNITTTELKDFFNRNKYEPKYLSLSIEFYMEDPNVEPDKEIFSEIVAEVEEMKDIPRGVYSIRLNDNLIDRKRAIGTKDNTLRKTTPDKIIKK